MSVDYAHLPHYVYRCYDIDGNLLYIGATRNVAGRLYHLTALCNIGKHPNGELRRRMHSHTAQEFPNRAAAFAAERAAIAAERPELNRQSVPA